MQRFSLIFNAIFKKKRYLIIIILLINVYILPANVMIPVKDASAKDWNPKTFWHEPWGASIVHKGIDIFAKKGQPVLAATNGITIFQGNIKRGGHIIIMLDRSLRLHYYAHLSEASHAPLIAFQGEPIGFVSNTGNAKGKPAHLHYSVFSIFPHPWRIDSSTHGWKKMFYLNPQDLF
ncbi:M23 family metallopeptidase [Thorsellia anophelis]|uniref:Peptidase family M23 n=1 Tax=Thorsellia anophelis DSM 18579 TaxID=1123402 RepID=A0A1I0AUC5_9GAMM|nr:M23 family metallopeptidase [Thorsellia anophelis]SES97980.1 Peptidase family M23 [Thorsellia anophelis DSM 18579]